MVEERHRCGGGGWLAGGGVVVGTSALASRYTIRARRVGTRERERQRATRVNGMWFVLRRAAKECERE